MLAMGWGGRSVSDVLHRTLPGDAAFGPVPVLQAPGPKAQRIPLRATPTVRSPGAGGPLSTASRPRPQAANVARPWSALQD